MKSKTSLVAFLSVGHKRAAKALCLFICVNELTILYTACLWHASVSSTCQNCTSSSLYQRSGFAKAKSKSLFSGRTRGAWLGKTWFQRNQDEVCVSVCTSVLTRWSRPRSATVTCWLVLNLSKQTWDIPVPEVENPGVVSIFYWAAHLNSPHVYTHTVEPLLMTTVCSGGRSEVEMGRGERRHCAQAWAAIPRSCAYTNGSKSSVTTGFATDVGWNGHERRWT